MKTIPSNVQPIGTSPNGRFINLYDEDSARDGTVKVGKWDNNTCEWRDVHGEVLNLEGIVSWNEIA